MHSLPHQWRRAFPFLQGRFAVLEPARSLAVRGRRPPEGRAFRACRQPLNRFLSFMSAPFLDAPGCTTQAAASAWLAGLAQLFSSVMAVAFKISVENENDGQKKGWRAAARSLKPRSSRRPQPGQRRKPKRPRRETRAGQPGEGVKAKAPSFKPLSKTEANSKGQKYRSSQISPGHHAMKKGAGKSRTPAVCAWRHCEALNPSRRRPVLPQSGLSRTKRCTLAPRRSTFSSVWGDRRSISSVHAPSACIRRSVSRTRSCASGSS